MLEQRRLTTVALFPVFAKVQRGCGAGTQLARAEIRSE